jgi:hypothetical protein
MFPTALVRLSRRIVCGYGAMSAASYAGVSPIEYKIHLSHTTFKNAKNTFFLE